jgi:alanine racemase
MTAGDLIVAEVNRAAVRHNVALLRDAVGPGVRVCPVVKANAYGHDVRCVLPAIRDAGVTIVAVATLEEAVELRRLKWAEAVRRNVTCTVLAVDEAEALGAAARDAGTVAKVHVKLDTGMGRAGRSAQTAADLIAALRAVGGIVIEGVYTHFATADEADLSFVDEQLAAFHDATAGLGVPVRHAANSAAVFRLPASHFELVRPGLSVYGYWPNPAVEPPVPLRPTMRVVSWLTDVKRLPPGHSVGYGRTFVTRRDSVIGLVPIGYEDGYLRRLSNRAVMIVRAGTADAAHVPVVGRVSMDQTVVDVTEVREPRAGEPVVVIDDDPAAPNSVRALARLMDTIPYEVTCGLGRRIRRVAVDR